VASGFDEGGMDNKKKIKVLCRNPKDYIKECRSDIHKMPRNFDPAMHPLESSREYVRALNATKLDRVFAKPFIGALSGHTDAVSCMCKHPQKLSVIMSGSCDGEIKVWNLQRKECMATITAHSGFIRGISMDKDGDRFVSVGDDSVIKIWGYPQGGLFNNIEPKSSILGKTIYVGVDCHRHDQMFATCGDQLDIWNMSRSEPVSTFTWGPDNISHVKFNPIQTNILATCGSDRSIALYDIRQSSPLQKVILSLRSNAVAWNPMEAFHLTAASEDSNLYTFDMRLLSRPKCVHMDHVSAVLDVDYSPTGTEFVSGGFDKTVRIFNEGSRRSREVYHTKRMQRIFSVKWTNDATYVLSGSDDMNVRIWKAQASQKLGHLSKREQRSLDYAEKIKSKYEHHPQIKRIAKHRHVPKYIHNAAREKRIMLEAKRRKRQNLIEHSKPGSIPKTTIAKEKVISIIE
jgi:WD repeat and SOF domain-containing protein 1